MTLTQRKAESYVGLINGLVLLIRLTLEWHGSVPVWAAVAGLVVSVSVGLFFGVWPAMKASKLDPVEALRCRPLVSTAVYPPMGQKNR